MSEPTGTSERPAVWIVEGTAHRRFPFRISIEQQGRLVIAFRVQARWPGPGQQIFCLRERALDPAEPLTPVERVPVAHLARVGRKLTLVLDRPNRKRCEFLAIRKPREDGAGEVEQVFFRTESGIRAHRSRGRVELRSAPPGMSLVIDSMERYPWRFSGGTVVRRKLAVGDYALLVGEQVAAVVERKSFDNLLTDFSSVQALHQQLADLASQPAAALVIEADYRDFLDPARLRGRWPAAHMARVLAELSALHPTLPIVYAGNRKLANAWAASFFEAIAMRRASPELELGLEVDRRYDARPRPPDIDGRIRVVVLSELPGGFAFADLAARLPDISPARLRRVMAQLRREGRIVRTGAGRASRWSRA